MSIDTQRSNSFSQDSPDILNEKSFNIQTTVECSPNTECSNPTMVVVTSPSFNSDLSSEQNDSIDQLNPSSLSFLQTKHRRIHHRRNKSEPVKSLSTEDLSSTTLLDLSLPVTTNNESPLTNNATNQTRKRSSTKLNSNNISPSIISKQIVQEKSSSSSTATTRKKKPWYNVSINFCFLIISIAYFYHFYLLLLLCNSCIVFSILTLQ